MERTQVTIHAFTRVAEAAIRDNQLLKQGTAPRQALVATGAPGEKLLGFARENAPVGMSVGIISIGVASPIASGAIEAGDYVKAAANGKVTVVTDPDDQVVGQADTAAVDGSPVVIRISLP